MRVRSAGIASAICLLLALLASQSAACTTPVYRYAMINWIPAPYRFYHFHDGQISEQQAVVNRLLDELAIAEPATTNMMFRSVNTSDQEQMELIAGLVKRAWKSHNQATMHLVMTPWGDELFAGELDEKMVRAMIDSPLRKRVCKLLDEGKTGVLLLLKGDDETENERAEKVITDALAKIAKFAHSEDVSPDLPSNIDIGVVAVSRADPAEQWLVRILLSVEEDLNDPEYASSAMVFAVLGRGTAMLPYIGEGISEENMIGCVMDLTGPCSCTIKSNCPAEDLLMQWDWSGVVERMAEEEAVAKYGPMAYGEPGADEPQGQPGAEAAENSRVAEAAMPAPIAKMLLQGDIATQAGEKTPGRFTFRMLWLFAAALTAATTLVMSIGYLLARGRR
ncbi:MAG: hypothetical protein V3V75_10055 [Thermoguttaceae bacterium]